MDGIAGATQAPPDSAAPAAGTTVQDAVEPRSRLWTWPKMHQLLFVAFTLVAAVPIAVLAIWESQSAFQNELDSVRERHLLVARNLTSTMSRYVKDLKATFPLAFTPGSMNQPGAGLINLLGALDVIHVFILNPDGSVASVLPGLTDDIETQNPPDPVRFKLLRALADDMPDEPVLSKLYHDAANRPVFYLVKALPDRKLGVGIVSTRYLVSLQQGISFGDRGHAVITDGSGQVIADPSKERVAASTDISNVPVVAAMMRGETGVGQFYSASANGMMIAGYAVVPETGWGVMVPQPVSELRHRADVINQMAVVIAVASFAAAALISYLVALLLARPVRQIAATAEAVMNGNEEVSAPTFGLWAPSELRSLGRAFNTMLADLRRKASETLQALRQAETSNRVRSQFLANMSHELRTPLNGVVGMLELLRLSGASTTQQNYIDQAGRSAQSLLRMMGDVLDLSEMEVGKIGLKPEPFRLDGLITGLREQYGEQAAAKGLTMAVSLPEAMQTGLIGDAQRIEQMLGNLLSNAIKFTASGGIALRVSAVDETPSTIQIRFEVGDTGTGIAPEMQQKIFEAFTQGDGSTTRRYGGSGLGLAIVKELCQRMNGEFGVQSMIGVGSTFWLALPFEKATMEPALETPVETVQPRPPQRLTAPPAPPPVAVPPMPYPQRIVTAAGLEFQEVLREAGRASVRILLVEDNPANLRVTQALLETLGCEVRTAVNGIHAVAAYRDGGEYDLVLMDCQMPEMDGYQATRAIRHVEAMLGRFTPIVALTAHAMDGSREECLAAGMNDQLSKPLTLAALTRKLLEWLSVDRPAA
ncbi:MAG TPA: ATP-binding protein [Acetobacteraceae bacterium]|nr:ATP-binding protein [Acetobacteraceae bacterium]